MNKHAGCEMKAACKIQGYYKRNRHFQRYVVASVDKDMIRSVWTELDNRIDICRVTKGSHIEHL